MQQGDLLISGGLVVDPERNFLGQKDILICGNKIITIDGGTVEAKERIEANGYVVTPGLIDHHTHLFAGGSELGLDADISFLPMGVTTAVDAGSAGAANAEVFLQHTILRSKMRIFCYLNVASMGQLVEAVPEDLDPQHYNLAALQQLLQKYPEQICGLKIRCDQGVTKQFGMEPLQKALALSEKLACRLAVHATNPPGETAALAEMLRSGDVFCHCYHGKGNTILDSQGQLKESIWNAKRRGVLFDSADARGNHSYKVLQTALAQQFLPDIISTDVTQGSLFGQMLYGLPLVIAKYLSLGLPLIEVIRACTATPAGVLGQTGKLGTLAPGAQADVAIFKLVKRDISLTNFAGEVFCGNQALLPRVTILDGKVVYRQLDEMLFRA